jgi:hypothetical protein
MARAIRIAQLEKDIRWQSDQLRAELRHTSADLRHVMNQSVQRYREMISENGDPYFLKSHSGVLPVGRATDPSGTDTSASWGCLDISAIYPDVVRIYGLDIDLGRYTHELYAVHFNERNAYQDHNRNHHLGAPVAFFGYDETKIGILPPANAPYRYTLWYLPLLPDLVADGDEFNPGIPGGEQWVIWDVMCKILIRDNYPALLQAATMEREKTWMDILRRVSAHTRVGTARRLDTRGMRSRSRLRVRAPWL